MWQLSRPRLKFDRVVQPYGRATNPDRRSHGQGRPHRVRRCRYCLVCAFSPSGKGRPAAERPPHAKAQADRAGGESITADKRDDIISGSMVPPATPMLLPIPLSHGAFTWSQPSRMRTRITSHRRVSVRADKTQQTAPKAGQTLIACGATLYSHRVLPDLIHDKYVLA